jgi:uncharacterized protein (DUF2236 family)
VRALGASAGIPVSWRALQDYMARAYAAGDVIVSPQARELGRAVLAPPFARAVAPAARANWIFTVGLLPPFIRQQYGFTWTAREERSLARWTRVIRAACRWMPSAVALWPEARR